MLGLLYVFGPLIAAALVVERPWYVLFGTIVAGYSAVVVMALTLGI